jgi:hypothetical protein
MKSILKSYFFWTYPRGVFHYDVMVTLILLFIFVSPHVWDFGDQPLSLSRYSQPLQVVANGNHGLIITIQEADANVPAGASDNVVRKVLKKAIQPVIGDAVFVEHWETVKDAAGHAAWKVWAHR